MQQPDSDWQQPPPISAGLPVTLQFMSSGAGVGVGCGVGVGLISPVNLSAVPVLGQVAQGISAGLGGISSWASPAASAARTAVRGLGVPGLDVGAGCGVLAGYYFGAGLMVKPSVAAQLTQAAGQAAGRLSHAVSQKLQLGSSTSSAHAGSSNVASPPLPLPGVGVGQQQQPQQVQQQAAQPHPKENGVASVPASPFDGMIPPEQQQQRDHKAPADAVVMRLLLQQQADIAALKKQNKQLKAAVCRLDPKGPVCANDGVWSE